MENELLTVSRSELKYSITAMDAIDLGKSIGVLLERDMYSQYGSYRVKSLYFDTLNDMDYLDKLDGVSEKKKIRLRTYDESSGFFKLECKEKQGDLSRKISLVIQSENAKKLIDGEYDFLLDMGTEQSVYLYTMLSLELYRPRIMIEYDRMAFVYPEYDTRLTLDTGIRYNRTNYDIFNPSIPYIRLNEGDVLEVKYNRVLTGFIKKELARHQLHQISSSKYEQCRYHIEG